MKPNRIREAFKTFPAVLQHQILLRLGMALGSSFFFTFCWLLFGEFVFASPFLLLAVWMGYSGIQMFRTIVSGSYTRIRTTCKQVITTAILKRPKAMILSTEKGDLRLRIQQRIRKPEVVRVLITDLKKRVSVNPLQTLAVVRVFITDLIQYGLAAATYSTNVNTNTLEYSLLLLRDNSLPYLLILFTSKIGIYYLCLSCSFQFFVSVPWRSRASSTGQRNRSALTIPTFC